ncbi:MAG: fmt [Chlamydiales bacterium]|jgi:methionyl-tRNA formyltransferase|nr:fmt [Chlamydiales bacterium]
MLRIVFFGTPHFASQLLETLIASPFEVVAVVSRPDRPRGRSLKMEATPVKQIALNHSIPIFQPEKASSEEFIATLKELKPDLFVVVAYGEIMRDSLLKAPRLGCINVHASLLPRWRGAAPIERAIMAGDEKTGITIMHMVRKLDAGAMILKKEVPIPFEAIFSEIEDALCQTAKAALLEALPLFTQGVPPSEEQDESLVTYAHKIETPDCQLDFHKSALELHHLIRALSPKPGAFCTILLNGAPKRLKVFLARPIDHPSEAPGTFFQTTKSNLAITCGQGALEILEAQLEGKQRLKTSDLLKGLNVAQLFVANA